MNRLPINIFRIGNFYADPLGKPKRVESFDFNSAFLNGSRIRINKDLITNLGLNRKSKNNGIFIEYVKRYNCYALCVRSTSNIICFPEYLDEVQNLYFATTRTELKVSFLPIKKKKLKNPLKLTFTIKGVNIKDEPTHLFVTPVPERKLPWWIRILKSTNLLP